MKKLLLVDGSNLLFQMFYGMPSRIINHNGKPIHGILGFVGALLKIIKETKPTHICVLFDGEHENPRKEMLKEYKSNRIDYSLRSDEDSPFSQIKEIYQSLDYLKIPYKELIDYETDDYISSYTKQYQKDMHIIIASWDSDYFSLIKDTVKIYRYRGKKSYYCDEIFLKEKYGITPNQYSFFKALIGDASDNIKGIPKIGPITAAKIVQSYSSIEELYEKGTTEPYFKYLIGFKELLIKNLKLISFYEISCLPFSLFNLTCPNIDKTTIQILEEINVLEKTA